VPGSFEGLEGGHHDIDNSRPKALIADQLPYGRLAREFPTNRKIILPAGQVWILLWLLLVASPHPILDFGRLLCNLGDCSKQSFVFVCKVCPPWYVVQKAPRIGGYRVRCKTNPAPPTTVNDDANAQTMRHPLPKKLWTFILIYSENWIEMGGLP